MSSTAESRLPDSLTAFRASDDDEPKYCGVWIQTPDASGLIDADLYLDVPDNAHQSDGWGPMPI